MGAPRVIRLYVAIEFAQGALLLALGHTRVVPAAIIVELLLLWGLFRGSVVCWVLLLVENVFGALLTLMLIAPGSQGVIWGNAVTLVIPCLVLVALLLTREMRAHVGTARPLAGGGL